MQTIFTKLGGKSANIKDQAPSSQREGDIVQCAGANNQQNQSPKDDALKRKQHEPEYCVELEAFARKAHDHPWFFTDYR